MINWLWLFLFNRCFFQIWAKAITGYQQCLCNHTTKAIKLDFLLFLSTLLHFTVDTFNLILPYVTTNLNCALTNLQICNTLEIIVKLMTRCEFGLKITLTAWRTLGKLFFFFFLLSLVVLRSFELCKCYLYFLLR